MGGAVPPVFLRGFIYWLAIPVQSPFIQLASQVFHTERHLISVFNVCLTTLSYLSAPNFGVTSKLETELEGMWKEAVMAEFDILSCVFVRTAQVEIKKIVFNYNNPAEIWTVAFQNAAFNCLFCTANLGAVNSYPANVDNMASSYQC